MQEIKSKSKLKKEEEFNYCISSGVVRDASEPLFTYDYVSKKTKLEEFIQYLSSGRSILPYKLKEGCTNKSLENFEYANLVFFDIDEGPTLEEGIKKFQNQCIAIYTTRNHQKKKIKNKKINGVKHEIPVISDRYRVVCAIDGIINRSILRLIQKAAVYQFFHDKQCVDASKGYLTIPGSKIYTYDLNNRLDVKSLLENYRVHESFNGFVNSLIKSFKEYNSAQALIDDINSKFNCNLILKTKSDTVNGENLSNLYTNNTLIDNELIKEKGTSTTTIYNNISRENGSTEEIIKKLKGNTINSTRDKPDYHKIRNVDFRFLKTYCKLLRNPLNSDHGELRHMLLNFFQFEGGIKEILKVVKNRPHNEKRPEKYHKSLIADIRNNKSPASYCSNFCSFHKDNGGECTNPGNLVTLELERRKKIIKINHSKEYISLEEGQAELKKIFDKIKADRENDITIVKAQTGIGKTFLIESIEETDQKQIIVGPTYKQLESVRVGVLYPNIPLSIQKKIRYFSALGISRLNLFKDSSFLKSFDEHELALVQDYLNQVEEVKKAKIIKVTHERFLTDPDIISNGEKVSNIWIDEDIIESLIKIESIKISDLIDFRNALNIEINKSDYLSPYSIEFINNILKNLGSDLVFDIDKFEANQLRKQDEKYLRAFNYDLASELHLSMRPFIDDDGNLLNPDENNRKSFLNLFKLINANHYLFERDKIHFVTIRELPANSKIAIFSATINEDEYKELYHERVKVETIPNIRPLAKLVQFNKLSFSKTSVQNNEKREQQLENLLAMAKENNFHVLSYKCISEKNSSDIYFYASEGIRGYEGKNILIIGTPFPTVPYLRLRSRVFGYNLRSIKNFNESSNMSEVEYGDYRFHFKILSDDPQIQKMQLSFTEKHLIQAIGRARIFSFIGKVMLFSNFPITDFEQVDTFDMMKIIEHFVQN
ncbi:hypothetical protein [Leptospira kmetyi]|uniref:Helicase ATP-binding domain-containing protein n=1 Tax=Leptospira kmetyi TaxID=408139 RepID=A0ABX4N4H0_9LEPT|nr:hypothetical protein [Leptospira kmetyi]PJZ28312.1 hypothetical protein CH378_18490 [Leptospira kmetyi]